MRGLWSSKWSYVSWITVSVPSDMGTSEYWRLGILWAAKLLLGYWFRVTSLYAWSQRSSASLSCHLGEFKFKWFMVSIETRVLIIEYACWQGPEKIRNRGAEVGEFLRDSRQVELKLRLNWLGLLVNGFRSSNHGYLDI